MIIVNLTAADGFGLIGMQIIKIIIITDTFAW